MSGRPGMAGPGRPGPGGGPGRGGPFGTIGMPVAKSKDFRGALRRQLGTHPPEARRLVVVLVLAVSCALVIAMGCWPTTTGRESLAHPARARPRERQANLRTVSSGNPRMMDFMGAIPLLEKPR